MRNKNNAKTIVAIVIFALFVLGAFVILSNRSEQTAEAQTLPPSAVKEVLLKNLDISYPSSPKEVVKFYSEITRCYYGEEYTEEELVALARKARELFDYELAANQTEEDYVNALRLDIESYKTEGKIISSFSVSNSTDVDYYDFQGDKWAQLYCVYSLRVGTNITPVKEKYLLRRDEEGHWKIYGWVLVEEEIMKANG